MFTLDTFDFGVAANSSVELVDDLLTIEIAAVQEVVETLWEDEAHPWHWVVEPPEFYVRDLAVKPQTSGLSRTLTEKDYEECEIGLLVGEHFRVMPCALSVEGKILRVQGVVERGLLDKEIPFRIEWDTTRSTDETPYLK